MKQWFENPEGSYWVYEKQVFTFEEYNKKFPHLSGEKWIASFDKVVDAKAFCRLKQTRNGRASNGN